LAFNGSHRAGNLKGILVFILKDGKLIPYCLHKITRYFDIKHTYNVCALFLCAKHSRQKILELENAFH